MAKHTAWKMAPWGIAAVLHCTGASAMTSALQNLKTNELVSGNTLVITNKFGTTLMQYHPDGRFIQFNERGTQSSGTWRTQNEDLCATVLPQPNVQRPKEHCISLKWKKRGATWEGNIDSRNGMLIYQLIPGHPTFQDLKK